MKVELARSAQNDLRSIGDHIARDDRQRAQTFVIELRDACLGLGRMPERFPVVERFRKTGIRRRVHGNYIIFYIVKEDAVYVLRVLNGASDYEAILFGEV